MLTFDSLRGPDGKVRAGVWDRICVPAGVDRKEGMETEFTVETMSQMIDNFVARGDLIPMDACHQSNYAHVNGQPAPALAFYGALAVVDGGQLVKVGNARDVSASGTEEGLDLSRDGLWGYRCEVTEFGQELLPNFRYVSPTFMSEGEARDGTPIGYVLAAVAATNTPFQEATQITFDQDVTATPSGKPEHVTMRIEQRGSSWVVLPESGDKVLGTHKTKEGAEAQLRAIEASKSAQHAHGAIDGTDRKGVGSMAKKFGKFSYDGEDSAAIKQALAETMTKLASEAMEGDEFAYEDEAAKLEEAAAEMAGGEFEEEGTKFSKMAAKFRRMAKFDADGDDDGDKFAKHESSDEEPAKMDGEKPEAAAMAVMSASIKTLTDKLAKFERAEAERKKSEEREKEKKFSQLADDAIAGGYPKDKRGALIKFARVDFEGARATVEAFLPKSGAPAHLFGRLSNQGAPIGKESESREFGYAPKKPRPVKTAFGNFVEDDAEFAEKARSMAESADPVVMSKVDKLLPVKHRPVMFHRLLAAQKIVRAEYPHLDPDMADSAE